MKYHIVNLKFPFRKIGAGALIALLLAIFFACTGSPKTISFGGLGRSGDPVPIMAAARTGTLPSGLRYYILENTLPENRAYLTLAVDAGSVLEEDDQQGLAHFVEHMAFNGTVRFPENELVSYLRSLGMRFGPEINAYTSFDQTVYGIEVPTETGVDGKKSIPSTALAVIDDWSRAITFTPKDVDDERPVIVEEDRTRLGAEARFQKTVLPVLFQGSIYANRFPIGLMDVVNSAPASRLEDFYKKWYRADNMALIFVGDFDGAALEASLTEHFSIPAPDSPLERPRFDLSPPQKGNFQVETFTDPELAFSAVYLYYKQNPEPPRQDLAGYRQGLIDNLINRMLNLRIAEQVVKPETPYIYAGAGQERYGFSSRYYSLAVQAKSGAVEESLRAILREKELMLRYGFTEGELQLASRALVSSLEKAVSEQDRVQSETFVNQFTAHYLEGEPVPDSAWELEAVRQLLPGIGVKDITAAIKDYFAAGDLRVLIAAPEAEQSTLPSTERVRQLVAAAPREKLSRPKDTVRGDELVTAIPQAGAIIAESVDEPTGAAIWELSNGARVILQKTRNRNNEVILVALARGGMLEVPAEQDVSVSMTANLFAVSGLGPYNQTELIKMLAGKQVSTGLINQNFFRGFQGIATTKDIKTLFELIYLGFTDPRIDTEAAAAVVDQYRTALIQQKEDPSSVFGNEISWTLDGNHPRFKPMEVEDLDKLDLDQVRDYLKWALNPADYTFVFAGNLELDVLRPLIETYVASIPSGARRMNTWTDPEIQRPGKLVRNVYKGKEEQSQVFMAWYSPNPPPYTEEAVVAAQALREYLDIELIDEIREALGGVYGISAGVNVSPLPRDTLNILVTFVCDPRRVEELCAAVESQINRVAAGDIDRDSFDKAREALLKTYEDSLQSNNFIAESFAEWSVLLNAPLDRLYKRPDRYRALQPTDLQALTSQTLGNGPARFVLYPEGWK